MKILHISDLHYSNSHDILDKISDQINGEIDLCLFTGDLVDRFSKPLATAFDILKKFCDKISAKNLFITCGNHDINREVIKGSFQSFVKEFKNDDEINNYVKDNKADDFTSNLSHLEVYNNLLKQEYPKSELSDLYAIHRFKWNEQDIVVVDLNFSWCAFNAKNRNDIIYPSFIIRQISKSISKCNVKILITHFPLSFLNENCRKIISDLIYKSFDCHFAGHSHEQEWVNYQFSENGLFTCIASSTMDKNTSNNIGYCLFDLDVNQFNISITNYVYHNNKFLHGDVENFIIPTNEEKRNEIKLFEGINNKLNTTIERANQLFVPTFDRSAITFNDIYTKTNIKTKGYNKQYSIESSDKISNKSRNISLDEFYKTNNYLVYGKEKSGKTVLLYKIIIDLLTNFSQYRTIPIYIDLKEYYNSDHFKLDITKIIQQQYSFSIPPAKILSLCKLKLLIDNFNQNNIVVNSKLFELTKSIHNCSFVINTTYFFDTPPITIEDFNHETVYIHDISRSNMRELTNKWPIENKFDRNDIFKKMVSLFSQLNIHFNYWTVSMFLCVIERTSNLKLHNNSELIDLYVENLLDKQKLSMTSNKTFSYDNFRSFLSIFAHYLYTNKSANDYSAKYSDIVNCYEEYRANNPRVVADVKVIIDYLFDKGIIYNISDDLYTFRLNGIFEYFLAYYMFKNPEFKYSIINNSKTYLKFKNELEIYSGLQKDDFEFLLQIYFNTQDALELLRKKYPVDIDYEKKIEEEDEDTKKLLEFASAIKNEIEPIPIERQDIIDDKFQPISDIDSNIQLKKDYNIVEIDAGLYAEHLNILGRVFRNLDEIKGKDKDLLKQIFRFLIDQSCITIYYTIQEFIDYITKNNQSSKKLKEFAKFITTFSPLLTHAFLFENVSHPTLSEIILEEIDLLSKKPDLNQYKLFVLYFLLIESNIEAMHPKIGEMIAISKHWNIRQSIFFKLIVLISIKCDNKPSLIKILKLYVEEIHKKIYPGKNKNQQPYSNKGIVNKIITEFTKTVDE